MNKTRQGSSEKEKSIENPIETQLKKQKAPKAETQLRIVTWMNSQDRKSTSTSTKWTVLSKKSIKWIV